MIFYYLRRFNYDGNNYTLGDCRVDLYSSFCTLGVTNKQGSYQAAYEYDDNELYISLLKKLKEQHEKS